MLAAGSGHDDIVGALLEKGADVNKTTPQGKTAWNFAKESQLEQTANRLWEKMSDDVREASFALYTPPPPRPARGGSKLSAKLIAVQEAVRKQYLQ